MGPQVLPINPIKIILRFLGRRCGGNPSDTYPQLYITESNPNLPSVQVGIEQFSDLGPALFDPNTTTPTNLLALQNLSDQFSLDYLNWRQTQFDTTFQGIAAVAPNGLIQTIEFKYTTKKCTTRISTLPVPYPSRQLGHQIYNPDSMCPDEDIQHTSTYEPYFKYFAPPSQSAGSGTSFDVFKWIYQDGRLVSTYDSNVNYPCGCSNNDCCDVNCSPCPLPKKDLLITWINPGFGDGSDTLAFMGTYWTTGCSGGAGAEDGLIFRVFCTDGQIELRVIYFTSGECPTGQSKYCSNINNQLTLQNSECFPLSITFGLTNKSCPIVSASGYTSFIITDPSSPPEPYSGCCVTICALNCMTQGFVPGVTITITDPQSGDTIATGVTGTNGCVLLDIVNPGTFDITSTDSPDGFLDFTLEDVPLTCCQTFIYGPVSLNVNIQTCGFLNPPSVEGIEITAIGQFGGGTGMTDANGNLSILLNPNPTYGSDGTQYTITATYQGQTSTITCILFCQNQIYPNAQFIIATPTIVGCNATFGVEPQGVEGATVVINGDSQTTDVNGQCDIGWIFPIDYSPSGFGDCTYDYMMSAIASYPPRFSSVDFSNTFSGDPTSPTVCQTVLLPPAPGYACVPVCITGIGLENGCNLPINMTLDVTDQCLGINTVAVFTPDVWGPGYYDWIATVEYPIEAYEWNGCLCPASSVTITYYLLGDYNQLSFSCGLLTWTYYSIPCMGSNIGCVGAGDGLLSVSSGGGGTCPPAFMVVQGSPFEYFFPVPSPWYLAGCDATNNKIIWTEP